MAIPKSNLRGVRDIPTRSGSVNQSSEHSKVYMKIMILEMEKERREKEKLSVVHRLTGIEERLVQIEKEKKHLLERCDGVKTIKALSTSGKTPQRSSEKYPGSFNIKY